MHCRRTVGPRRDVLIDMVDTEVYQSDKIQLWDTDEVGFEEATGYMGQPNKKLQRS